MQLFHSYTIALAVYSVPSVCTDIRVISATSNVFSVNLPKNKRLLIFCCSNSIAAAESAGLPSTSFENHTFATYCFGSVLNSASSGFLGLVCWNLIKIICMYPEMGIFMFSLL